MIKYYYLMLMSECFNRVGKVQGKHILNMNIRIQTDASFSFFILSRKCKSGTV